MSTFSFVYSDKVAGPAGLKNLIQNGPTTASLAAMVTAANWPGIANALNDKTITGSGPVAHANMQATDVAALVDWSEFDAQLTTNQKDTWQSIMVAQSVPIGVAGTQAFFDGAFTSAGCPNTRAALQAKYTQPGSLLEVECGTGVATSNIDVQYAMTGSGPGNSWGL